MRNSGLIWRNATLLAAVFLTVSTQGAAPALKKGCRLAIIGDSITEQRLYSVMIESYLLACAPELDIRVMQFGWSGETAGGFLGRMDNDLAPWKPDVVTTCYGMNDGGYRKYEESIGNPYRNNLGAIVAKLKSAGATTVVGSPGVVDSFYYTRGSTNDAAGIYNDNLAHLSAIAKDLALSNGMPFADIHGAMLSAMDSAKAAFGKEYPVGGMDGVHPGPNGQLVMAYAFLKALGVDGDIGTINVDWQGKTSATRGHTVVAATPGKVELESARYPFCVYGATNDPNGTASIVPFMPFHQDLNRFRLVVANLPAAQADVKWGDTVKTFTAAQLAQGINLAAEFPQNPFHAPFQALVNAVAAKQAFETLLIKGIVTQFRLLTEFKDDAEFQGAQQVIRRKLDARDGELRNMAKEGIKPVRHTLEIIPQNSSMT
jgi:lysophospholipase L1-like esterase